MALTTTVKTVSSGIRKRRRRKAIVALLYNKLVRMHSKRLKTSQFSSSSLLLPPQVCVKNSLYQDAVSDTFSRLSSLRIFSSQSLPATGQRDLQSPEQFALTHLLGPPISWSLATDLTMKSERTLRPRPVKSGSAEQRTRKGHVS